MFGFLSKKPIKRNEIKNVLVSPGNIEAQEVTANDTRSVKEILEEFPNAQFYYTYSGYSGDLLIPQSHEEAALSYGKRLGW